MRVSLIAVPYDLGRADVGSGRGPGAYLKAGAAEALRARGHEVEVVTVRRESPFEDELQAVLAVDSALADAVERALFDDALPLVVGGNCNVTLGVQAGLQRGGAADAALVWLDAHGDFNTPATTETGYLDGMPLAMLCGRAYRDAVARELDADALPESSVLHAGGRDFDREERASLLASDLRVVEGSALRARGPATHWRHCSTRWRASAARPGGWTRTSRRRRTCTSTSTCSTRRPPQASPSPRRTASPPPSCSRPSTSCASASASSR